MKNQKFTNFNGYVIAWYIKNSFNYKKDNKFYIYI